MKLTIIIDMLSGIIVPSASFICFVYAIYLSVKKAPSPQKMMNIDKKNVEIFTRNERNIFLLWGITGFVFETIVFFINPNTVIILVCAFFTIAINIYGYYLRVKNNTKYLN